MSSHRQTMSFVRPTASACRLTMRLALLSSVAVGALATAPFAGPAGAQNVRDEIVVTARRREETLQTVPLAVTAFDQDSLTARQADTLAGLQGFVPNLNLVQGRGSSSSANIFIRGIGQPDALSTFDPGTGVYVDDVYISRIRGALFDVYDIERIEVLRGPQGTLYGKNSIAGAVKLVSRQPGDEFDLQAEVTAGSYERVDVKVNGSGPLVDGLLYGSFSFYSANRNGFVTDPLTGQDYNDKETMAGRVTLRATPSDDWEFILNADYAQEQPGLTLGRAEAPLLQTDLVLGAVELLPAPTEEFDFLTSTTLTPNQQDLEHYGISLKATWDINEALTLKSITAYRNLQYDDFIDIDASVLELGDVLVSVDQYQVSQEFQALYETSFGLELVAGLYYLHEKYETIEAAFGDDIFASFGTTLDFTRENTGEQTLDSYAGFLHGTYDITDKLSFSAGARYTYEEKEFSRSTFVSGDPFFDLILALSGIDNPFAFDVKDNWNALTTSVSLDYQWTDEVLTYARVGRGFKSGGFNGRALNSNQTSTFDPEFVWTYELGAKTAWMDNRVIANAALFYNDYTDFQARVARGTALDADLAVLNAGSITTYGAEFELTLLPIEGMQFSANLGYLEAEYDEFMDGLVDRSNDPVPFAPEWTVGLLGQYTFDLDDVGSLTVGASGRYRSDMFLSVDIQQSLFQDSYWIGNFFATYEDPDERFYLRAGVTNVTDTVYKTDAQEFSNIANIQTAYYGDPRQFFVTLGIRL